MPVEMDPSEAVAAREKLGFTQDDLAADLNLTPAVIAAWERGDIHVPKRMAEQLRWRVAVKERSEALQASGLPECEWRKGWEKRDPPKDLKLLTKYFEEFNAHEKACATCQARDKYVQDRFGEMPAPPAQGWLRIVGFFAARIEKLPRWTQPMAWGAIFFGAYSLLRIVLMLPRLARQPEYWFVPLEGLAASMSIGAIGGLIYSAYRSFREHRQIA